MIYAECDNLSEHFTAVNHDWSRRRLSQRGAPCQSMIDRVRQADLERTCGTVGTSGSIGMMTSRLLILCTIPSTIATTIAKLALALNILPMIASHALARSATPRPRAMRKTAHSRFSDLALLTRPDRRDWPDSTGSTRLARLVGLANRGGDRRGRGTQGGARRMRLFC